MINLLPDNTKQEIRAARSNITLVSYIVFLIIGIIFLSISCVAVYMTLNGMKKVAEDSIELSSNSGTYREGAPIGNISTVIGSAQSILSRQMPYSSIVMSIGSSLPFGVIVDKISFTEESINQDIVIEFRAKSASITPELVAGLQKSPMFSNVTAQPGILSTGNSPDYPVLITCMLSINKDASL